MNSEASGFVDYIRIELGKNAHSAFQLRGATKLVKLPPTNDDGYENDYCGCYAAYRANCPPAHFAVPAIAAIGTEIIATTAPAAKVLLCM